MILHIKNLKKQYGDKIVTDIENLEIEEGKKYALIGANGSGKTTLLRILARGENEYLGTVDIDKKTNVGYMPQKSFGFSMSVLHNMMLTSGLKNIKHSKRQAILMLEKLKLSSLKRKNASRLSGGETQRLAIGRLLTVKFDLLLLDEPTASMDTDSTYLTERILDSYLKENQTALIFATHSIKQAERFADQIIFLSDGKIVEQGTAQILLQPQTAILKDFLKKA